MFYRSEAQGRVEATVRKRGLETRGLEESNGHDSASVLLGQRHPEASLVNLPAEAAETPISAIMKRDVVCVGPDVTMRELLRLIIVNEIGGVPVVHEATGRPLGIVSKTDVLRELYESSWRNGNGSPETSPLMNARVMDLMTPIMLTISESASITRAAALMAYERVHRLIVTSDDMRMVGLVSPLDILGWLARKDGYAIP